MEENIKRYTLGLILSWFFGVLFGFGGLFIIFNNSVIGGGSLLIASFVLLPSVNNFTKEKFNIELSGCLKTMIVVVLFFIYIASLSNFVVSDDPYDNQTLVQIYKKIMPQAPSSDPSEYGLKD